MNDLKESLRRIWRSRGWVAAQFWATLLLILAGVAWTRLPDKHAWQVGLALLLPILMIAVLLVVQARTMRNLLSRVEGRTPLVIGTLMLLVWVAVVWLAWWALNWCDDQIPSWAGYLNSRASAHARATVFTYGHIQTWLTLLEWILRWIVIPAKAIPYAIASAQWGWRLPWRRLFGLLLNWRWWLAVVAASLIAVALPVHFFSGIPHGTVAHQVWAVIFKLAGAYLLAVVCWVLLLAWAAVLFERGSAAAIGPGDDLLVLAPQHSGPRGEDSVRLPLPESSSDAGGNA